METALDHYRQGEDALKAALDMAVGGQAAATLATIAMAHATLALAATSMPTCDDCGKPVGPSGICLYCKRAEREDGLAEQAAAGRLTDPEPF